MQKSSLIEFELDCNFAFREVSVNRFATLEEVLPTAGLKFYGIQKGVDSQWFLRKTGNMDHVILSIGFHPRFENW